MRTTLVVTLILPILAAAAPAAAQKAAEKPVPSAAPATAPATDKTGKTAKTDKKIGWDVVGAPADPDGPLKTERAALVVREAKALVTNPSVRPRPVLAASLARQAVELAPTEAAILRVAGEVLAATGDWDEADTLLARAAELDPQDNSTVELESDLAARLASVREPAAKGIAADDRPATARPTWDRLRGEAQKLMESRRWAEALEVLDDARAGSDAEPEIHLWRGDILRALDRHSEALSAYWAALRRGPASPPLLYGYGASLFALGDDTRAQSALAAYLDSGDRDARRVEDAQSMLAELKK